MKKLLKYKIFILTLLIFIPAFVNATSFDSVYKTNTSQNVLKKHDLKIEDVENMLREENIDEDVIKNLINKLKRGEIWDSQKPEYQNLKPQIDTPNYKKTTYPDGSVNIIRIKDITPNISTRSIIEERNVEIAKTAFVINAYFYMDYKRDTSRNLALITNQYDINVFCYGADVHNQSNGYSAAWSKSPYAYVQFQVSPTYGGETGKYCYLRGYASANGHWVDYSY